MTAHITNFWGAETGGLEELSGSGGSPVAVATSPPPGGNYYYSLGSGENIILDPFESISLVQPGYIVGCRMFISTTAATNIFSVKLRDSGNGVIAGFEIDNNANELQLIDTTDTAVQVYTISEALWGARWRYYELYVANVVSGELVLFVNGKILLYGDSEDSSGTVDHIIINNSGTPESLVDDIYFMANAAPAERFGPCRVMAHQNDLASQTPDIGNATDAGNWENVGYTPSNVNEAGYTGAGALGGLVYYDHANANGQGRGPQDQELDDDRAAMEDHLTRGHKFVWDLKRGNGSTTIHEGIWITDNNGFSAAIANRGIKVFDLGTGYAIFNVTLPRFLMIHERESPSPGTTEVAGTWGFNPNTNRMVGGNESAELLYSDDFGMTWQLIPSADHPFSGSDDPELVVFGEYSGGDTWLAVCTDATGTIAGATSTDDGKTWTSRTLGFSSGTALWSIGFGNNVFVVCGNDAGSTVIRRSTNGGVTWAAVTISGSPAWDPTRIAVDDANGDWVVMSATNTQMLASQDNGANWAAPTTPPAAGGADSLTILGSRFFSMASSIYYSDDGGVTWTDTTLGQPSMQRGSWSDGAFVWADTGFSDDPTASLNEISWTAEVRTDSSGAGKTQTKPYGYANHRQTQGHAAGPGGMQAGIWHFDHVGQGFYKSSGGREIYCKEMWAMTLQPEAWGGITKIGGQPSHQRIQATRNLRM